MVGAAPFSRHAGRGVDRAADGWDYSRAVESVAHAYGWGPDYVDAVLTDEQLIAYLDAHQERIQARAQADFDGWVEAVRVGTIFAHDNKQYGRWRAKARPSQRSRGLTGEALEAAVGRIAQMFPQNVVRETA